MKVLLYGARGYIGGHLLPLFEAAGHDVVAAQARMEQWEAVGAELDAVRPTHVVCAAGATGRPNVDWCEDHRMETMRDNVVGPLVLAAQTCARGLHLTVFGSGCVYTYDAAHPVHGAGFREDEPANFAGSFYSRSKVMLETALEGYGHVLVLRLRLPLSADRSQRSLLTKLLAYERVVDVPNAVSVLPSLLPVAVDMVERSTIGVFNFTNPGVLTHPELLELYRSVVDPTCSWKLMSLDEQAAVLRAGRSNTALDVSRLLALYPDIPEVHDAVKAALRTLAAS
jgi:3,5-epimerase/4-reductase